jgi:hypothetical protein
VDATKPQLTRGHGAERGPCELGQKDNEREERALSGWVVWPASRRDMRLLDVRLVRLSRRQLFGQKVGKAFVQIFE